MHIYVYGVCGGVCKMGFKNEIGDDTEALQSG